MSKLAWEREHCCLCLLSRYLCIQDYFAPCIVNLIPTHFSKPISNPVYLLCLVLWLKEGKRFSSQIFCRVGWSIQGRGSFCQSLELLALMTSQCFGNILSTDMELELLVSDPVMASLGDYSEVGGFSWSLQYSPHQDPDLDRKKFKVYFQRSSVYSCKLRDLLREERYHIKTWWRGFPISIAVSRKNVTFLWKTTFLIFFSFLL